MKNRIRLVFCMGALTALCTLPALAEEHATKTGGSSGESLSADTIASDVLSAMDRDADPCHDFYRYACGHWIETTEMPSDQSRWARSFSVINERNREVVRDLLEAAAKNPGAGGNQQRIGHFYASCMDEAAVENAGAKPLEPLFGEIAKVEDAVSAMRVAGKLQHRSVNVLMGLFPIPDFKSPDDMLLILAQGGLGMPDRDYYVSEDPKKKELLAAYERHVARNFELLGETSEAAAAKAAAVVAFETELAEVARPRAEMRNINRLYNKIDRSGLVELTPELAWKAFFEGLGHPDIVEINVATPEFFERLETLVHETEIGVLRDYLRWHTVRSFADVLSSDFVDADFAFYGRELSGQQEISPRWKRCVGFTENALGEAVGELYVAERFAGSSKDVAVQMIQDIETAFAGALPQLAWMDETTQKRALEKMEAVGNKIGYPDEWRDYSSLEFQPENFFANFMAARQFEADRQLSKVGGPVDPDEWGMTPQMVNAYYNPLLNEIAFPAGILQPPFFHRDYPAAMNYGGIGAVVGHELSHGFDDQGRKFDPDGRLREWWEPEAAERFERQAQCVREQYDSYEIEPGINVQGELTLGENIADLGGLKQSYRAYKLWEKRHGEPEPAVEGLTNDQLFFVAYGQVWCALVTPEVARLRVTTDPHSPPEFRVKGPVSHNPVFRRAFGCEPGTPMAPEKMCEVW